MYILGTELRSSDLAVSPLTPEPFNHLHLNHIKSILHNFWFPYNISFWSCVVLPLGSSTREHFIVFISNQNSDLYKNKSRSGQNEAPLIIRVRWFLILWPAWPTQWVLGNQRDIVKPCLKQNKTRKKQPSPTTARARRELVWQDHHPLGSASQTCGAAFLTVRLCLWKPTVPSESVWFHRRIWSLLRTASVLGYLPESLCFYSSAEEKSIFLGILGRLCQHNHNQISGSSLVTFAELIRSRK